MTGLNKRYLRRTFLQAEACAPRRFGGGKGHGGLFDRVNKMGITGVLLSFLYYES